MNVAYPLFFLGWCLLDEVEFMKEIATIGVSDGYCMDGQEDGIRFRINGIDARSIDEIGFMDSGKPGQGLFQCFELSGTGVVAVADAGEGVFFVGVEEGDIF